MTAYIHPVRTPLVLPVAGAITVGLFFLMRGLIDIGDVRPEPAVERPPVVIHYEPEPVDPHIPVDMDVIPLDPPPPTERLPIDRVRPTSDAPMENYTVPAVDVGGLELASNVVPVRRDPLPVVRIPPVYPDTAARRGLEGQCTMIFDITPQGTTANVRPLDCTSSLFERASVNAVSRWRYDPQVRDGEPTLYRGATTQLRFSLDG